MCVCRGVGAFTRELSKRFLLEWRMHAQASVFILDFMSDNFNPIQLKLERDLILSYSLKFF